MSKVSSVDTVVRDHVGMDVSCAFGRFVVTLGWKRVHSYSDDKGEHSEVRGAGMSDISKSARRAMLVDLRDGQVVIHPSVYQKMIREVVRDVPAHHVEAWLRLEYGTLDGIGEGFADAARSAVEAARLAPDESEALAESYDLVGS